MDCKEKASCIAFFFLGCILSVTGESHSDRTKHVAGWNKSERAKVRELCFCADLNC